MSHPIRLLRFRFRNEGALSSPEPGRLAARLGVGNRGYALVAVMILVTVLLISLTASLPGVYQEGQREREKEAIFRGEQYARAVYLFHRQYGRYPSSVKELIGNGNGTRFLRQAYRDPLSPNGRWRFIHATAAGLLIDSWNQDVMGAGKKKNSSQTSEQGSNAPSGATSGLGSPSAPGSSSGLGPSSFSLGSSLEQSQQGKKKHKHPPSSCDQSQSQGLGSDSSEAQTGILLGAFIVGVAPCNNRQSIRVFNDKTHYEEWEFLGLNYVQYGIPRIETTPSGQPGPSNPQPSLLSLPGSQNQPSSPAPPTDSSTFSNPD
ncbi:MAG TPA: hypothetical protein VFZ08_06995 [Terriglobia bacterium]|nr:hypothetical protein [Terriglobia bacterium]